MPFHFNIPCSDRNAAEAGKPAAIVQPATRNWHFYESAILKLDDQQGTLLKEYKLGGTWKERYKTWTDACVPLNLSRREIDRLIEKETFSRTECPNVDNKKEEAALKKVEQARPPKPTEAAPPAIPDFLKTDEELEKPRVKTAQESIADTAAKNGIHKNGKENGKPKSQLAVWKELEDLYGRALNRIDEANRAHPDRADHTWLIAHTKACLERVKEWRAKA